MALTWNDLMLRGSIVTLAISKWPARLRITPMDLGIDDSKEVDAALVLGSHRLLPREAFAEISAAAGRALKVIHGHSLPFGMMWGARYVPDGNMAKLGEKLKECRAEFYGAVESFITNYEKVKAEQLPIIKKALLDAAQSVAAVADDTGAVVVPSRTKEEVAAAAYARLCTEYPPADIVRGKFGLSWGIFEIKGARDNGVAVALQDEGVEVKNAIAEMARSLRDEVTGKLGTVLGLIQRGGKLQKKSIDAALAVLDHVESVNVLDDEVLAKQVAALRRTMIAIKLDERVPDATVSGLTDIKVALESNLAEAVAAAEEKLAGVGRRKLMVAAPAAADQAA